MSHKNPFETESARPNVSSEPEVKRFGYAVESPTSDPLELIRSDIFRGGIENSIISNRFSQTPLLPELLFDDGISYPRAVNSALTERVGSMAERTELPDIYAEIILYEVIREAERRIDGNTKAGQRLARVIANESSRPISLDAIEAIWSARTGDATLANTGELLLRYPAMQSLEGAKYTQPLDANARNNMNMHIDRGLHDFAQQLGDGDTSKVSLRIYQDDDFAHRNVHFFNPLEQETDEAIKLRQSVVTGIKDSIALIQRNETAIELVRKQTVILLPPEVSLKFVLPNIKQLPNGSKANIQPIATSCYWRVVS